MGCFAYSIQHSSILQILDDLSDRLKKVTYPANCNDIVKTIVDDIMFAYNAENKYDRYELLIAMQRMEQDSKVAYELHADHYSLFAGVLRSITTSRLLIIQACSGNVSTQVSNIVPKQHLTQEEMNQLNSQGIFSNNPIDSNDSPPGNNQQVCAVYNYPAGCIKSDGSTTPFATALY